MSSPPNLEGLIGRISGYPKKALMYLIVAGALLGAASSVRADPVTVGGLWHEFGFGGPGSQGVACVTCVPSSGGNSQFAPNPPWTFALGVDGGTLTVTDAFQIGDSFDVFDFGVLIGSTPSVAAVGICGDNPVPCFANPAVSHAVFSLTSGNHSITIFARDSPFDAGAAYFRVDQAGAIPEPATMILLGTGLAGIANAIRRRKMKGL